MVMSLVTNYDDELKWPYLNIQSLQIGTISLSYEANATSLSSKLNQDVKIDEEL